MSRFRLVNDEKGSALEDTMSRQRPLRIDFASPALTRRIRTGSRRNERLVRAVGAKPGLRIVDCTAGLGRDSFVLASFGCDVTMIERSHLIAHLLRDALDRAAVGPASEIVSRLRLIEGEAASRLRELETTPDVIYLDPMFPPRVKHARVKGEMQMLQRFIGADEDIQALVNAAMATGCPRIVLKRPAHGKIDDLNGWHPSFTLKGRTSRFEVALNKSS